MATTRIRRQDLDNLAEKLETLGLTGEERAALLAIFAIAADALGRRLPDTEVRPSAPGISVTQAGTLPDISTIFDRAFRPSFAPDDEDGDDPAGDTVGVRLGKIGQATRQPEGTGA